MLWTALLFTVALAGTPPDAPTPVPASTRAPLATEGPSPARQCADAAEGKEIEVCLAVAAEHPEATASIAAALRAHVDRAEQNDRKLLSALLLLLAEDTGVQGAQRLGELGDPRAVGPLTHAGEYRELPVATAAATALGNYEAGLEPLSRWVADRHMPIAVRVAATEALGQIGDPGGADVLIATLRTRRVPIALGEAMTRTIQSRFPDRAGEIEHEVSRDGTWWLVGAGSVALGYGLGVVGYLGRGDLAPLGIATGGAAGGTAGWVIGRTWPMEASDAAFVTTTGTLAVASGTVIGSAIGPNRTRSAWLGGLVGDGVGFSLAYGLRGLHHGSIGDSLEATGVAGLTALATGTLVDFGLGYRGGDDVGPVLATGLGLAAGTAVGHLVAPRVDLKGWDAGLIGLGAAYGTAVGLLVPVPEPRGLPAATFALGTLGAYGLSGVVDPTGDVLLGATTGLLFGGGIGAGVGLLLDSNRTTGGNAWRAAALGGATLGMAGGAWSAWHNYEPINSNDVVFTSLVTGWATWQSIGLYSVIQPSRPWDGVFVLAPPLAGGLTAALTPVTDIPPSWSFSALSFGLWGGYIGGTTAQFLRASADQRLLATLLGSDAGLGLGFFFASPPVHLPPLVLALGDTGGVLGGSLAALVSTFFVDPRSPSGVDTVLASSLGGLAAGFTGGALLGGYLYRTGRNRDVALALPLLHARLPGRWSLQPAVLPGKQSAGYGALVQVTDW